MEQGVAGGSQHRAEAEHAGARVGLPQRALPLGEHRAHHPRRRGGLVARPPRPAERLPAGVVRPGARLVAELEQVLDLRAQLAPRLAHVEQRPQRRGERGPIAGRVGAHGFAGRNGEARVTGHPPRGVHHSRRARLDARGVVRHAHRLRAAPVLLEARQQLHHQVHPPNRAACDAQEIAHGLRLLARDGAERVLGGLPDHALAFLFPGEAEAGGEPQLDRVRTGDRVGEAVQRPDLRPADAGQRPPGGVAHHPPSVRRAAAPERRGERRRVR